MENKIKMFCVLLFCSFCILTSNAQKLQVDYGWGSLDQQKIINSKDDGFISITSGNGKFPNQTVVKVNSNGELVFRYEAKLQSMFKKFVKDGETWHRVFIFEMSDNNIIVWFSAAKDNHCPSSLYYYILSPEGSLQQASRVPLDRDYKTLEIAQLDNMVMLNDLEVIFSLSFGPTCKDIFINGSKNTTILFNLANGNITYLSRLYGHEVLQGFSEGDYLYVLTKPVRFYRSDDGTKEYRENRFYQLWKLDKKHEVMANPVYYDIQADNPVPKLVSEKGQIRMIYCRRVHSEVEYGYKIIDKILMIQTSHKLYNAKLFADNVYAASENYFLTGSTLISDSTGDNMILFPLEYWSSSRKDKKNVYAQVVKDEVLRNETNIKVIEEKDLFAVSQINRKGKYLMAANYGFYHFLGDVHANPLPIFHFNEKENALIRQRLYTEHKIEPGTLLVINDISRDDRFYPSKAKLIGNKVKAGDLLVRYGNGMYSGYLVDKAGDKIFMYGVRLAYEK